MDDRLSIFICNFVSKAYNQSVRHRSPRGTQAKDTSKRHQVSKMKIDLVVILFLMLFPQPTGPYFHLFAAAFRGIFSRAFLSNIVKQGARWTWTNIGTITSLSLNLVIGPTIGIFQIVESIKNRKVRASKYIITQGI